MMDRHEHNGKGCAEQDHVHYRPKKDDRGKSQDDHQDERDLVVAEHVHIWLPNVRGPELKGCVCGMQSGEKKER
jgi:hypothetical protein